MKERDGKNLKELFEKFLSSEEAEQAVEDVQVAEQILLEHPAPEPDDVLIANIKSEISEAVWRRQRSVYKRVVYRAVVAAAVVVIIVLTIGERLFENGGERGERPYTEMIPTAIWDSDNVAADDVDLVFLTAEVEELEGEVLTLQSSENGGNGDRAITELEMELIAINSDFWKG